MHANVGHRRDRGAARATLWAVATETRITSRIVLLAEAFGEDSERPFLRAGARYSVLSGELDVDLTVVTRPGGPSADQYVSIGLFWQSGRFLP